MKLTFLLLVQATVTFCQVPLLSVVKWNQIDYVFPSQVRNSAIQQRAFIQKNVFPIDVAIDYDGSSANSRIFITTPKFSEGVPISLGYVISPTETGPNPIIPYPDYSWHSSNGTNCNLITSVFRVWIDECRQLWVLDTGVINNVMKCPPQLLVFDLKLKVNPLIWQYKFPDTQFIRSTSLFITPIVDVSDPPPYGNCKKVKVYIADVTGNALIVYDSYINQSWKITNNFFHPNPNNGRFTIAGESFDLMDGLFSLALSPRIQPSQRFLYFHALASFDEYKIPLNALSSQSSWNANAISYVGSRGGQTPIHAMDRNGNLWFVMLKPLALVCWDSSLPYTVSNFRSVLQDDLTLQFASGLKIVTNTYNEDEIVIVTNRFQKIANNRVNPAEINYRVQARTLSMLLQGNTRCYGQRIVV